MAAAGLAGLVTLGAGACGGDDDDDSSAPSEESTTTLATEPASTTTAAPTTTTVLADPVQRGARLVAQRGCTACHTIDGKSSTGPTWQGLFRSAVKLEGGKTVTADEPYLRRSILEPDAQVVAGFASGIMPAAQGGTLTPEQINDIIAYLKTL